MELASRLRDRLPEIEQAIFSRMVSVADPAEVADPEYVAGLHAAVRTAILHGLTVHDGERSGSEPIPPALLTQARAAARIGVSLDVVLRRYFAGYTALGEFVTQEAERLGQRGAEEARLLVRAQAPLFDRVIAAVTEEHGQEVEDRRRSAEHARVERVRRLLAGDLVDDAELGYELGCHWHLGAVATGPGVLQGFRELAVRFDRRLLLVQPANGTVWAWLGGRRAISTEEVASVVSASWPEERSLAIGEPSHGISGWRLTHRQALAAFPVTTLNGSTAVAYGGIALLAAAVNDDVLASSLQEIYLAPLARGPDRGAAMRQTLRAYFASGGNVSSAAAALGVSRKTVAARLCTAEERLGRSLAACAAEMETALRLQGLSETAAVP